MAHADNVIPFPSAIDPAQASSLNFQTPDDPREFLARNELAFNLALLTCNRAMSLNRKSAAKAADEGMLDQMITLLGEAADRFRTMSEIAAVAHKRMLIAAGRDTS